LIKDIIIYLELGNKLARRHKRAALAIPYILPYITIINVQYGNNTEIETMTPKTERFEMRLDPALLERVDAWRSRQGDFPSRAEAIRRLIEVGVAEPAPRSFQPTNAEKLMIWLLTEILKGQKGYDGQDRINLIQEAIYGGHFWALDWELTGVMHDHADSRKSVSLVRDTLDMWSFIERAYKGFSVADRKRIETAVGPLGENPKFSGFDGNNETEYMGITRFFVEKMGRFGYFKGRDFNSHFPVVERYRQMTAKFEPMQTSLAGRELSVSEVIELLKRT
jgi:uncharacterized protein YfbU (UPF0304 family)